MHRHDPPDFAPADWSFVDELMDLTSTIPGWFRNLPAEEREAISRRFWAEGRLKLEPWLTPRLDKPFVHRWPRASVRSCRELPDGGIEVELSNSTRHVVKGYELGANSYVTKPTNFDRFSEAMLYVGWYWLNFNESP